ncbi:MAG: tetratricopeptide repeat protein [Verrucomicrobiota bacterium]
MRNPGPLRFPVHKGSNTFRIFILGESAAMGDPAQSFAPYRYLEMLLREKYPDKKFEVINVAFTAINSHVILPIARECAAHEGDLWIIYMGNNEMVGPFGATTVFGSQSPSAFQVRLVTGLQRLRIGQLLMETARKISGQKNKESSWGGMTMFLQNRVKPDSPIKETVYRNFEKNLHDIVRAGINSGAKVMLNTVAVNLKDCPPFATLTNEALSSTDRAQFDQLCADGLRASGQQEFPKAAGLFEQAARLDSKSAELQFTWGECELARTNWTAAREHFQLACDNDALPFRADSRINSAIRAEQEKFPGKSMIPFDAEAALAAGNESKICGQEVLYEHVHFDFDARYRLGLAWAKQVVELLPPNAREWASQGACDQMLGLTEWNRAQVIHYMIERIQTPPLSSQANNDQRREMLESRLKQLGTQMNRESAKQARELFQKQLSQRPEDYFLHQEFALFLELSGNLAGAAAEWQRFRDLLPQDCLGYYQTGRLLISQQRYAEAEASLRIAVAMRPSRTDGWIELGNALALQKKYPEALDCYSTALKQDPLNAQTLLRRGKVWSHLKRSAEAVESYRAAIKLNPKDGSLHYELALELIAMKELDAAGKEFGEAAQLNPGSVAARFAYGRWLLQQKRWDEAQREFEAVVRLEPGNVQAQNDLARLKAMGRRTP